MLLSVVVVIVVMYPYKMMDIAAAGWEWAVSGCEATSRESPIPGPPSGGKAIHLVVDVLLWRTSLHREKMT